MLYKELAASIEGELLTDLVSRQLYATDASIYQEIPRAVVRPKNRNDCIEIVQFANKHSIPLIPRTAGTSIAGQCVGNGVIVDISRYMTNIIGKYDKDTICVQPGVILDDLNDFISAENLTFPHDISTSNRCMLGGMIGNNACGSHSILYGTTRDHVVEIEAVLSDGSIARFKPLNIDNLNKKLRESSLEGNIYRNIYNIIDNNQKNIKKHFPKPEIIRRNTGYALDYLANHKPWNKNGKAFNLAPFLCGSEGTLALITEATLQLVPIPKFKLLICVHFSNLTESMLAVATILRHNPAAVELIDKKILDCANNNLVQSHNSDWIQGNPSAILVVELFDDNNFLLKQRVEQLITELEQCQFGYAYPIIPHEQISKVWSLRKAGLGLLMGVQSEKKAIAVIEDTAVAVSDLPAYVNKVQQIMENNDTQCVYYGHASVGLLHLRPELNLREPQDQKIFLNIANQIADLVAAFKGSLSGEHGDGRVRSPYLKKMFGKEIYQLLIEVKQVFDPKNIFNPDKIITNIPIDQDLRVNSTSSEIAINTQFDWKFGLKLATEQCNGSGVCRKGIERGTMCPSYKATKEEFFSTRGRANLLRQALNSENPIKEFASEELKNTLDLCLSCKACKSECPANVDMSKLKSEFLNHYYGQHGIPFKTRIMQYYALILRLGATFPKFSNYIANSTWFKKRLQVAKQRKLPLIATESLKSWWKKDTTKPNKETKKNIILLCDIFTQYHEPNIAQAAIKFLKHYDYNVIPFFLKNSPRLLISQGLLKQAKQELEGIVDNLFDSQSIIIGLEPSELLTLRDEAIDLFEKPEKIQNLNKRTKLFEEFVLEEILAGNIDTKQFIYKQQDILVHIHCHQKSLIGVDSTIQALKQLPGANVIDLQTGCCGMSGSFGYEHYDISMTIGEMKLFPALRKATNNEIIVATGTSCRHQIADGVSINALHPAQVFCNYIKI